MHIYTNSNGDEVHEDDCPLNGEHGPTVIYRKDGSIDMYVHGTNNLIKHEDPKNISIQEWAANQLKKYLELDKLMKKTSYKDATVFK